MLENVLFVYRIGYNRTLEDSPFFMLYGRDPVLPQDLAWKVNHPPITESIDDYKMNRLRILRDAYNQVDKNRKKERHAYQTYYDRINKWTLLLTPKYGFIFIYKFKTSVSSYCQVLRVLTRLLPNSIALPTGSKKKREHFWFTYRDCCHIMNGRNYKIF